MISEKFIVSNAEVIVCFVFGPPVLRTHIEFLTICRNAWSLARLVRWVGNPRSNFAKQILIHRLWTSFFKLTEQKCFPVFRISFYGEIQLNRVCLMRRYEIISSDVSTSISPEDKIRESYKITERSEFATIQNKVLQENVYLNSLTNTSQLSSSEDKRFRSKSPSSSG